MSLSNNVPNQVQAEKIKSHVTLPSINITILVNRSTKFTAARGSVILGYREICLFHWTNVIRMWGRITGDVFTKASIRHPKLPLLRLLLRYPTLLKCSLSQVFSNGKMLGSCGTVHLQFAK
jgi:hypothetical protein